ncbi:Rpn family recombination-promoting nuclease/putative transposase [Cohnella sp. GbtcB17]|uniref:Rpn family recombination-promoting nuclease/putative transposase n=1 Tax=Cohnella sp. GbtcB17 TaxID=2824762 RepID=UPI001C309633|nr:Rpn family recombination-promoting nuclease/putative transposase [Cohnella sp. GbtcB17]
MAPHDEAFKKLLQTFFKEFIQLFFPELDEWIDYSHTRLLMQELLVDIVGAEARQLDLLIETKLKGQDAYILIHLEPQSYRDPKFVERMYIYFSRLFEKYRADHRLIVPIAIFTGDGMKNEPDTLSMALPWHEIFRFRMLKLELGQQDWRRFIDSDNPVAAALLAKMGYNKKDRRSLRLAYLSMLLRMKGKLDSARLALVRSIADLYYGPDANEEKSIMHEFVSMHPEEEETIMELMPAWERWGYERGIKEGIEQGKKALQEATIGRMRSRGFSDSEIADLLGLLPEEVGRANSDAT